MTDVINEEILYSSSEVTVSTNSTPANGLSRSVKIAIVALASVIVFLFVLVILLATSRGSAAPAPATLQPPTPIGTNTPAAPEQPLVIASPSGVFAGGPLTVFGSNWTPGDTVTVFLRDPAKPSDPIVPVGSGQVTAQGTVAVKIDYPTEPRWAKLSKADMVVQSASTGAYVFTTVDIVPAPTSPTPTETAISVPPTATSTPVTPVAPSATATRVPPTSVPPTATPRPITEWRGEYYANTTLTNAPIVVRNDSDVNFNWGRSAPASGLPVDNFSARWTRTLSFAALTYRFSVRADDGVRVWLDNALIIDEWHTYANTTYSRDVLMSAGAHSLRIEFYEAAGEAFIQFKIEQAPQTFSDWKGEYYANTTLTNAPSVVRNDLDVNFNWGGSAPASGLPADNFSARWTRTLPFAAQTYRFSVRADDGVRVWVDNTLIIDEWHTYANTTYSRDVLMTAGAHGLRIEFYEAAGEAFIQFKIEQAPQTFSNWKGEYWANSSLSGLPAFTRNDVAINFDWSGGAPINGLPVDNFSARWTRTLPFDNAVYRFTLRADDGVRLYIDGLLIIDEWHDADGRTYTRDVQLSAGNHSLRIDYYEHTGGASIAFSMQQAVDFTKWKGEYFANDKWSGLPAVVRNDDHLDFDWGNGSPDVLIPADRFSVRWTRTIDLDAGVYRFDMVVDDGVRFYVDGTLVLDKIGEANNAAYTVQLNLTQGQHTFRLDYVEMMGKARFTWTRTLVSGITPTPTKTATATPPTPTVTKTPTVTPQPGLVIRGRVRLNSSAEAGLGGVGIYRAFAGYPAVLVATTDPNGNYVAAFQNIPGDEMVTVYAQLTGYTFDPAQYNWRHYFGYEDRALDFVAYPPLPTATPTATSTPTATPTATSTVTVTVPTNAWRGEYFANTTLAGTPTRVRVDAAIQFDWGTESPISGLPTDHFSVRWTRAITAEQGLYRFTVQADDGVRISVDGNWLLTQAEVIQAEPREAEMNLTAGRHVIVVEYFENEGPSAIRFDYQLATQP